MSFIVIFLATNLKNTLKDLKNVPYFIIFKFLYTFTKCI